MGYYMVTLKIDNGYYFEDVSYIVQGVDNIDKADKIARKRFYEFDARSEDVINKSFVIFITDECMKI